MVPSQYRYDGRQSDIWSCGVMLYLMLMGAYPFQDGTNPAMFSKTVKVQLCTLTP
jgi:serine/threonine-protein kinase SRK2